MKQVLYLILITILFEKQAFSQSGSESPQYIRAERRFGISLKLGGAYDILGGLESDIFISPIINIELDLLQFGLLSNTNYIGGGINYFPWGKSSKSWTPYLGLLIGYEKGTTFLSGYDTNSGFLNIPLGLNYIGNSGFNFSFDLSLSYVNETTNRGNEINKTMYLNGPIPGFKFGYRF